MSSNTIRRDLSCGDPAATCGNINSNNGEYTLADYSGAVGDFGIDVCSPYAPLSFGDPRAACSDQYQQVKKVFIACGDLMATCGEFQPPYYWAPISCGDENAACGSAYAHCGHQYVPFDIAGDQCIRPPGQLFDISTCGHLFRVDEINNFDISTCGHLEIKGPGLGFGVLESLLPDGLAWKITPSKKNLAKLNESIAAILVDCKKHAVDLIFSRFIKKSDTEKWAEVFGVAPHLNEFEKQSEVESHFAALSGGSIQDILQAAGFQIYVHSPYTGAPPHNKKLGGPIACGDENSMCGNFYARCGETGDTPCPPVHDVSDLTKPFILGCGEVACDAFEPYHCGEIIRHSAFFLEDAHKIKVAVYAASCAEGYCGDSDATCGNILRVGKLEDPDYRGCDGSVLYFSAEIFGNFVQIDSKDKERLEKLVYNLTPANKKPVLFVEYV